MWDIKFLCIYWLVLIWMTHLHVLVKVICDRRTGRSKGYGFVQYSSESEADIALQKMDGQVCQWHWYMQIHMCACISPIFFVVVKFKFHALFPVIGWEKYPCTLCHQRMKKYRVLGNIWWLQVRSSLLTSFMEPCMSYKYICSTLGLSFSFLSVQAYFILTFLNCH